VVAVTSMRRTESRAFAPSFGAVGGAAGGAAGGTGSLAVVVGPAQPATSSRKTSHHEQVRTVGPKTPQP
jgi:hypothetical protein